MPSWCTAMTALRVACGNSCLHWRSSAPSVSTSSACTKEWTPPLPTVASYSESSLPSQSLSGSSSVTASEAVWPQPKRRVSALAVREYRWTRSGLGSSGIRAVLGHRSRPTPGSAKARHKGQWLGCPKPRLQPRPQVLDLPHPTSADSPAQNHPIVGSCPSLPLGNLQGVIPPRNTDKHGGEHEQSGS